MNFFAAVIVGCFCFQTINTKPTKASPICIATLCPDPCSGVTCKGEFAKCVVLPKKPFDCCATKFKCIRQPIKCDYNPCDKLIDPKPCPSIKHKCIVSPKCEAKCVPRILFPQRYCIIDPCRADPFPCAPKEQCRTSELCEPVCFKKPPQIYCLINPCDNDPCGPKEKCRSSKDCEAICE